jgi:hypothetical protein
MEFPWNVGTGTKEHPRVELTSLFGAEAVGRTGLLGAL